MASNKSNFNRNKQVKKEVVSKYAAHESDTGSPMVQIAIFSERITYLSDHLKKNKQEKDD
jgi:small subunit ribosomal protein S15